MTNPFAKLIIVLFLIVFFSISCKTDNQIFKKHQKYANELELVLSQKYFLDKVPGKQYSINEVFNPNDSIFIALKNERLLNEKSYFFYSNKDCILLITRISENSIGKFKDILVGMNNNVGEFLCGINQIYSLNQNENTPSLSLHSYNITGSLNMTIVKN